MKEEDIYTSTGGKLLFHPNVVKKIIEKEKATPVSLSIAPTSKCQLNCVFCSNANREKNEELDPSDLTVFIKKLHKLGLKTIEWTGGGDPLLYPYL
jgi:MoaA/NifB/PqqE/SkfB family radical SAM enzyme